MLNWLNARAAVAAGTDLADQLAAAARGGAAARRKGRAAMDLEKEVGALLQAADRDPRTSHLSFYQRARFANAFLWRLRESGVQESAASEATRRLVVHVLGRRERASPGDAREASKAQFLFAAGNDQIAAKDFEEAIRLYRACLARQPNHAEAHNNAAAALTEVGRYAEAEAHFRAATEARPDYADAHANLGLLLRRRGRIQEAVDSLRRAVKLKPDATEPRWCLASSLLIVGRFADARAHFRKALKLAPRHPAALLGMAQLERLNGRFADAERLIRHAIEVAPRMPAAWAALAGVRKMKRTDSDWLASAESLLAEQLPAADEAELRYAIGKFCDDTGDYQRAFENFRRANELERQIAEPYDRAARERFVNDAIRAYPAGAARSGGTSPSRLPILVVGMPRSGTSLVEQILASHPAVHGAGELPFWGDAIRREPGLATSGPPTAARSAELARAYERVLAEHAPQARHVIDKAPLNSDHLGLVHAVFPNAKVLYLQRDPIDVCLSCYFQQLSPSFDFAMDLADLAHFYREHRRLLAHWRAVLPKDTLLEVPYAALVSDQAGWTRRILDFLGLDWDPRCLDYHATKRPVVTASHWQVRQKMYSTSVQRWRNYAKFIGPLAALKEFATAA